MIGDLLDAKVKEALRLVLLHGLFPRLIEKGGLLQDNLQGIVQHPVQLLPLFRRAPGPQDEPVHDSPRMLDIRAQFLADRLQAKDIGILCLPHQMQIFLLLINLGLVTAQVLLVEKSDVSDHFPTQLDQRQALPRDQEALLRQLLLGPVLGQVVSLPPVLVVLHEIDGGMHALEVDPAWLEIAFLIAMEEVLAHTLQLEGLRVVHEKVIHPILPSQGDVEVADDVDLIVRRIARIAKINIPRIPRPRAKGMALAQGMDGPLMLPADPHALGEVLESDLHPRPYLQVVLIGGLLYFLFGHRWRKHDYF